MSHRKRNLFGLSGWLGILAAALATSGIAGAEPITLHRGIGVHEWLNWSPVESDGSYKRPPYRSELDWLTGSRPVTDWPETDQFQAIRRMGFDFVRLSVDPGPLVASEGVRRAEALGIIAAALDRINASGLKVVLDLHAVRQVPEYSIKMIEGSAEGEGVRRYRDMVKSVAAMVAPRQDRVALEPFNEPQHYPCETEGEWQKIVTDTVSDIRSISTSLTIVVTGACGGNITGLVSLDPTFDDPNIYYSFHMYEPHAFTHQLVGDDKSFASGLPWPASAATPEQVMTRLRQQMSVAGLGAAEQEANVLAMTATGIKYFDENWGQSQLEVRFRQAVDWADQHRIPTRRLFMGEFGVFLISAGGRFGAYDEDRLRYIAAVRMQAEKFGIPWSLWEYANPHGISLILPTGPAVPDAGLLRALGLL